MSKKYVGKHRKKKPKPDYSNGRTPEEVHHLKIEEMLARGWSG